MRVDRSRFLKLVAALSTGSAFPLACATAPPGTARTQAESSLEVPRMAEGRGPLAAGASGDAAAADATAALALSGATTTAAASLGIWASVYDPVGPPKTCAMVACGDPTNEGMSSLRRACSTLSQMLRPEPFQRFLTCMLSHNRTDVTCDLRLINDAPGNCLERWSSPPVVDPQTVAKCAPVVAACANVRPNPPFHAGALAADDCQRLLSVTAPRFERKMLHCAGEQCAVAPGVCYLGQ